MIFLKILFVVLAYLIGSIPFGLIFSKLKGIDLRKIGSGNVGAANTGRALGKKFAFLTFFLDMCKGAIFVILFRYKIIDPKYLVLSPALYGFVAMLGHSFSIFLKFKGGKAVSTGAGFIFAYIPLAILILIAVFAIVLLKVKIISIASLSATVGIVIVSIIYSIIGYDFLTSVDIDIYFPIIASLGAILVFILHIPNIKRIINGTEKKYEFKK